MTIKLCKLLAPVALLLASGCASLGFEPTANWQRDGGRLCAANRDTPFAEFDRAAPRSCAQALADASATLHGGW